MAAHFVVASPLACTLVHPLKHRANSKVLLKRCALPTLGLSLRLCKASSRCVGSVVASASCSQREGEPQDARAARIQERVERLRTLRREGNGSVAKVEKESFAEVLLAGLKKLADGSNLRALISNTALMAGLAAIALLCTPGTAHAARSGGRMGGGSFGGYAVFSLVCVSVGSPFNADPPFPGKSCVFQGYVRVYIVAQEAHRSL